jgi:hypothetical protein
MRVAVALLGLWLGCDAGAPPPSPPTSPEKPPAGNPVAEPPKPPADVIASSARKADAQASCYDPADTSAVRQVMHKKKLPQLVRCYEDQLRRDPNARGDLTARFTIDRSGAVTESRATGVTPELADCIAGAIKKLAFRPLKCGPVQVEYPMRFPY